MNLEKIIGYKFTNEALLFNSLCRTDFVDLPSLDSESSYYVHPRILENIGDSVLDLIIRKKYYRGVNSIGELDNIRKRASNNKRLSRFSISIGLEEEILWSSNEKATTVWLKSDKVLANCFETVIGAIFLDSDLGTVEGILEDLQFFNI